MNMFHILETYVAHKGAVVLADTEIRHLYSFATSENHSRAPRDDSWIAGVIQPGVAHSLHLCLVEHH